jgi:hypothetical protein
VLWVDSIVVRHETGEPAGIISVIDVDEGEFPLNPRDLPRIWGGSAQAQIRGLGSTWSSRDTIAVAIPDFETILLQLERS